MLSPTVLRYYGHCLNYCFLICAVPFYWNHKKRKLIQSKSTFRWICSVNVLCGTIVFIFVILERVILIGTGTLPYRREPMMLLLMVLMLAALVLDALLLFPLLLFLDECVRYVNMVVTYA